MRPIILLGLVMEPEASCTWETKKSIRANGYHSSYLNRSKASKGRHGSLSCTLPALMFPWPLSERPFRAWGGISRW